MSEPTDTNLLTGIRPGERAWRELHVGALPSGTPIRIRAHVVRAIEPGPCVLLLGGVHGDEVNGIEIVRQITRSRLIGDLRRGTVILIPLLNVYGFLNFARDVPDGKDVNRSFPGYAQGSLASRVAYVLRHEVLPLIDFGVDFHTGGNSVYNFPQVRYAAEDPAARVLAQAFAAPVTLESAMIDRSLRKEAHALGCPMLVYEGGENMRVNGEAVREARRGVRRLLASQGMAGWTTLDPGPSAATIWLDRHRWLRATRAGLFDWRVRSGRYVEAGEVLGYLRDPYGEHEDEVIAPRRAFVIGQDNSPVVNQGDALFHLAWASEEPASAQEQTPDPPTPAAL